MPPPKQPLFPYIMCCPPAFWVGYSKDLYENWRNRGDNVFWADDKASIGVPLSLNWRAM